MQHYLASMFVLWACISLALCKPLHIRQKRATREDTLGKLVAEQSGIINDGDVPMCDCKELKEKGGYTTSGRYIINLDDDMGEFEVFCDMTLQGGGWTVIQRRVDNTTSFDLDRKEYNVGFGHFDSNFWLGLKKIKRLTDPATSELYIGLESFLTSPDLAHARYSSFSLGTDEQDYPITISGYDTTGSTAGDAFEDHSGEKFSTPDEDNDSSMANHCAEVYSSGWWYHNCLDSHLNGIYYWDGKHPTSTTDGIVYDTWVGTNSLKTVVMAVRRA